MNDLVLYTYTEKDIKKNPAKIGEEIYRLAIDLQKNKENLEKIRDRNLFKRIFANNSRDLAEAILKQNDAITSFTAIVQGIILICNKQGAWMTAIYNKVSELHHNETNREMHDSEYVAVIKDSFNKAIQDNTNKRNDTLRMFRDIATTIAKSVIENKN